MHHQVSGFPTAGEVSQALLINRALWSEMYNQKLTYFLGRLFLRVRVNLRAWLVLP